LAELSVIRDLGDHLAIGALTRHHDVATSPVVAGRAPLLREAAAAIADPQVRHRGTIGGSLAHADPAADLAVAVLALDATIVARGPAGERLIPADRFFTGRHRTALAPDELLVEVRVPVAAFRHRYLKFHRNALEWAVVAVAVVAGPAGCRVALAGMGPTPLRATAVEAALAGGAAPREAALVADEGTDPPSDLRASAGYRRHLAKVLVRRALEEI
jgi:aerobic carbon-monoxide dehydrogenase medium subunit